MAVILVVGVRFPAGIFSPFSESSPWRFGTNRLLSMSRFPVVRYFQVFLARLQQELQFNRKSLLRKDVYVVSLNIYKQSES